MYAEHCSVDAADESDGPALVIAATCDVCVHARMHTKYPINQLSRTTHAA